jgi:hypothetical protein
MENNQPKDKLLVGVLLEGEEIERFHQYKEQEKIRANAVAGRKLLLERLGQIEQQAEPALAR